jgi:hypothetical protein
VPVTWIHRSGVNSDQDSIVADDGHVDLLELEDIGLSIGVVDHCFHRTLSDAHDMG